MRKPLLFMIAIAVAGVISYYVGYQLYVQNRPQIEANEYHLLQKNIDQVSLPYKDDSHYLLKIHKEHLIIYKMPEGNDYDSLNLYNLQLDESERMKLKDGKRFHDLVEVYEYLENCMR